MQPTAETGAERQLQALAGCKSLGAVLVTAMGFEEASCRFYAALALRVCKEIRPLGEQLATEEKAQYVHLRELAEDERLTDHLEHCVERPDTGSAYTCALIPYLPDDALDDDLLDYALSMDRIAFEYYRYLFDLTPAGPLNDLFAHLATEKLKRIRLLKLRWASMFSIF